MTTHKLRLLVVGTSIILFLISLFFDAITIDYVSIHRISSIDYFGMGALAILGGGLQEFCIWLANPLAVLTIVGLFKNFRFTIVTSIAAFLLALSFLSWKNILGSESGVMGTIVSFEAGYYLWLSSIIVLMLGTNYYFYKLTKS